MSKSIQKPADQAQPTLRLAVYNDKLSHSTLRGKRQSEL